MTELMQQMRDPKMLGANSVGSIPSSLISSNSNELTLHKAYRGHGIHSTPASNLKLSEQMRYAQHDGSPTVQQQYQNRLSSSKSYTSGLNVSAGSGCNNISNSTSLSSLASLNDISASNSQFFEVLYVGKIKVSHKRVPFTFIDDALPKFKAYDAHKLKIQLDAARRHSSVTDLESDSDNYSNNNNFTSNALLNNHHLNVSQTILRKISEVSEPGIASENESGNESCNKENTLPECVDEVKCRRVSQTDPPTEKDEFVIPTSNQSTENLNNAKEMRKHEEEVPIKRDRSASIGSIPIVEQNRTMVFLIGKTDLRLISPDRKQVLLHKEFKDVASCAQGQKNSDHFGIICRDVNNEGYIGYVFKCQSEHVADEIILAISQAFLVCSEQKQKDKSQQIFSCEHCPMLWYHKLCQDLEGLSDKKIQNTIFRRMDNTLTDEEQKMLMEKFYGAEESAGQTLSEQNQFIMMLLRAHCESKQQRHVHDTIENRTEFLNQYLGGSTIFMKAKRSLTSSFDHLLKRRPSKDDFNGPLIPSTEPCTDKKLDFGKTPMMGTSPSTSRKNSDFGLNQQTPQLKSPMMDIFIKVGNSPKENSSHSWRQAMLNQVVTPSKNNQDEFLSPLRCAQPPKSTHKRTKEELRELWRIAIRQTIILSRMEKENAQLQKRQNENEIKRIKLEYDEIIHTQSGGSDMWDTILNESVSNVKVKRDQKVLLQAIKNGVPRSKRGEIWLFLSEQHSLNTAPIDTTNFPNYNTSYETLLKNLTEHQHAIFIDLGRTFPDHKYYKDALGVGQLSLFNLLKAYSILDPELGYCQGLGFICGVLLLHLEEAQAFQMLKHLMFKRQMRTKYLPDMKQFQLQLYQLSRLLKDTIPELYFWFDENDISPTLYAAPWILTLFSSAFPLGFVTRVFDLLFLESFDIVFRVAISLLNEHKDELLKRDNFEDIMSYLKNVVPNITPQVMEQIFKNVFKTDISRQLIEYQVEYNVLQEEMTSQNHHIENLNRVKEENRQLEAQLQFAQSSLTQMEKTRHAQQSQIQQLQSQVQSLENTVQILGNFITNLIDNGGGKPLSKSSDFVLPNEVCRILQQLQNVESQQMQQQQQQQQQQAKKRTPIFLDRKIGKSLSFNSNLGLTGLVVSQLNVLEEEQDGQHSAAGTPTRKKPFFEKSFEHIRQQKAGLRLNKLQESFDDSTMNGSIGSGFLSPSPEHSSTSSTTSNASEQKQLKTDTSDSGIATPISPQINSTATATTTLHAASTTPMIEHVPENHPLSNCGDVNFQFNGTTQLKSIRPMHNRSNQSSRNPSLTEEGLGLNLPSQQQQMQQIANAINNIEISKS
uniref:Putative gtp n=1 Tax=Corethrella appendiculata TaxID=1370023 RepID=W4VR98_9DIPT